MSAPITYAWIQERIKKTIAQHFQQSRYVTDTEYLKTERLHFIGGIMQTALHLLPNDKYFEIARWCYETYGYDPGGQADGQMTIEMWEAMNEQDQDGNIPEPERVAGSPDGNRRLRCGGNLRA